MSDRIVLAYSGGLDTSVCIGWLGEETGQEVVAVAVDVGQGGEDMDVIRQRALDCGAVEAVVVDAKDEFAEDFCLPALRANALYMDRYPLVSALSRPLIVRHLVAAARSSTAPPRSPTAAPARATTRSGSRSASPISRRDLKVIAPVRDYAWTREKAIAYAEEKGLPIDAEQEVAVLDRPERLGPRGRDRLPGGHLERARSRTSTPTPPTRPCRGSRTRW